LSERTIHVGVLVGSLALAGWIFWAQARGAQAPQRTTQIRTGDSLLSIIPPGSAFVLSADIAELRQASIGAFLAERFGPLGRKVGDLPSLCGFDPLAALDQIALAVPSAGDAASEHGEDFGVLATGRFSAAQITRCASASITQRGGNPVSSELGAFRSVRDRKADSGEVAARDGGMLIVSGGRYFRQLLDAAAGNREKDEHQDARDARHAALRRALGPGTIVLTWLLSEGWFELVSGDISARLSPLRNLKALGARVAVTRDLRISVLLECADSASITELEALLGQLRSSLAALPINPALSGIAQRINARHDGPRLRLDLTLTQAELQTLLDATLGPAGHALPPSAAPSGDILQIPAH
jgi:hypothetical protein